MNDLSHIGYFQEKDGSRSMGRLMSFITVMSGVFVCLVGSVAALKNNPNSMELLAFGGSLILSGFTGKVVQKFGERDAAVKAKGQ